MNARILATLGVVGTLLVGCRFEDIGFGDGSATTDGDGFESGDTGGSAGSGGGDVSGGGDGTGGSFGDETGGTGGTGGSSDETGGTEVTSGGSDPTGGTEVFSGGADPNGGTGGASGGSDPTGGGALPMCIERGRDANFNPIVETPARVMNDVADAVAAWAEKGCGEGFKSTARDVTCSFASRMDDVTSGDVYAHDYDTQFGRDNTLEDWADAVKTYVDADGNALYVVKQTYDRGPSATFGCSVPCKGTTKNSLAEGAFTGAGAGDLNGGYIPMRGDVPEGRSLCAKFQDELKQRSADCSVGDAKNEWTGRLGSFAGEVTKGDVDPEVKKTEWIVSEDRESDKEHWDKGARRVLIEYRTRKWTRSKDHMEKTCADLAATKSKQDLDAICAEAAAQRSFGFSSVIPTVVCIPAGDMK
ncbi:MAG: hypothetical protein U0169_27360 [Polyangiaceae bacterium]